jgi:hypothetical protein
VDVGCDVERRERIQRQLTERVVREDAPRLPCWTEVEAVTKAAGLGIAHGREVLWKNDCALLGGQTWWCYSFSCGPEYAAHVAANAPAMGVNTFDIRQL